ncbi:TerD family protein [Paenimyroides tangerinum]|uniref:TerD family protein n=1 Tax=Paenimyroides tangerinum TaxID=2488728 RepID=A0A3P3WBR9_9FLAO|nr:TerD family protein [Paenimyroides tangerinum]RRJ90063.1 TerD family protein [Paenimyroides tangerinum]
MAIDLQKGQRINLKKENGSDLQNVCVGVNWGVIEKKGWFGGVSKEAVDLDASCVLYDGSKNVVDLIFFGNLFSKDGSIRHSGDDLTGDLSGDDGLDNEIITLDFSRLNPSVEFVAFVLNSFQGHDFADIPFASIRIFEGSPSRVNNVFATYNIAKEPNFSGSVSMVMGVFYKRNNEWKFNAIGEPTRDRELEETVVTVQRTYL